MKRCPRCAETVDDQVKRCRYCGYEFGLRLPLTTFIIIVVAVLAFAKIANIPIN